jgi:hypothetical protein
MECIETHAELATVGITNATAVQEHCAKLHLSVSVHNQHEVVCSLYTSLRTDLCLTRIMLT